MTITQILENHNIVPPQRVGTKTGATKSIETLTRHQARFLFGKAKLRLLDINQWSYLCGKPSADFKITDEAGQLLDTVNPEIGHLIRISIPGPENNDGNGYDWVRIEQFEDHKDDFNDEEHFGFRVRPVKNPLEEGGENAHFYSDQATSTFLIIRKGNSVIALERGRNEVTNKDASSFIAKMRNIMVSLFAMIGFSNPQWKRLMKGLIEGPPDSVNLRT